MSLDIAVLDEHDAVVRRVSIGVEAHYRLMAVCDPAGLELFSRLRDYYSEGEIFQQEFGQLESEIRSARSQVEGDTELMRILGELAALVQVAREKKRSLLAIPD